MNEYCKSTNYFTYRRVFFPAGALNVDVPDVFLFTIPSQQIYTPQRKGLWDE